MLLASFRGHLLLERALAPSTAAAYMDRARRLLIGCAAEGGLVELTAADVTRAVLRESTTAGSVGSVQYFVVALRAFLRFCFNEGLVSGDMSAAALTVTGRRRPRLPAGISRADADASNRSMVPTFEQTGTSVLFSETRDGHTWENWRDNLRDALSWDRPRPAEAGLRGARSGLDHVDAHRVVVGDHHGGAVALVPVVGDQEVLLRGLDQQMQAPVGERNLVSGAVIGVSVTAGEVIVSRSAEHSTIPGCR